MRRWLVALALWTLSATGALATPCGSFPFQLANGVVADATQVMADLNLLLNCTVNSLATSGANTNITSLLGLSTPLTVPQGGTGAATGAGALTSLGAASAASLSATQASLPGRNFAVNPILRLDQRFEGAAQAVSTGTTQKSADQWQIIFQGVSTGDTVQRVAVTGHPAGYQTALQVVIGIGSATINAGDFLLINQNIEGFTWAPLGYGQSTAAPVSAEFWVNSSIAGTFGVALRNASGNRSYVTTFVVPTPSVWQLVQLQNIVGDVTGTWNQTNASGVVFTVALEVGSSGQTASVNAWQGANVLGTAAQTQLTTTTSATFSITGLQIESGAISTAIEVLPFQQELAKAQRYVWKTFAQGTTPAQALGTNTNELTFALYSAIASNGARSGWFAYPVPMRAAPSITLFNPGSANAQVRNESQATDCSATTLLNNGVNGFNLSVTTPSGGSAVVNAYGVHVLADAGF